MEFSCRTPTKERKVHSCTSRLRMRSRSRCFSSELDAISTPDRFIPSRQDRGEYSSYEVSKSLRKEKVHHIPLTADNPRNILLEKQNFSSVQRVLSFSTPPTQTSSQSSSRIGGHESAGYWDEYTSREQARSLTARMQKKRNIPTVADNILNAPDIIDDFYLNLLHWGNRGILAVGLGHTMYLLKPQTLEATALFTTPSNHLNGSYYPSALRWNHDASSIAVGLSNAEFQIWDPQICKLKFAVSGCSSRIGCLSWHPTDTNLLCAGSQSGKISLYDVRVLDGGSLHQQGLHSAGLVRQFQGHSMDICSLQWSPSGQYLASGGNDNFVNIWNTCCVNPWEKPIMTFKEHTAAVKAMSWCPWKSSLIATGGGTADKTLHLWNVLTGAVTKSVETKSQISGIVWSMEHRELLTAHGYEENTMMIWDPEILQDPLTTLRGHSKRILQLTMSPDGQEVATVSADETLRIWKCFTSTRSKGKCKKSLRFAGRDENGAGLFERDLLYYGL